MSLAQRLRRVPVFAAYIALLYNFGILIAVAMDQDWVRARAAGGQFEEFPMAIRVLYFFMAVGMMTLIFLIHDLQKSEMTERRVRVARYLGFVFILSTFLQLISRSSIERWNAVPAAIVATCFLLLARKPKSS